MELNSYQQFVHTSRYARYLPEHQRRETWAETVKRYCDFWQEKYPDVFPYQEVYDAIYNMEVMPSMRALMTAGPALERDHMAGFNCAFAAVNDVRIFDEALYVLMCGTGLGFSVERQFITHLPEVADVKEFTHVDDTIVVRDSKGGWASALRSYVGYLYMGNIPRVDVSKVRPAGAPLKTFGGRSSGPQPFLDMLEAITRIFRRAAGRKLNSIECHDIVCTIASCVVVGGVRRSALISLSNLTDKRMQLAKTGQWWENEVQRSLANNSVAYTEKPDVDIFMEEWASLKASKSGERGIFSRSAAKKKAGENGRRNVSHEFGTNPCGEIILRPNGLCNLTEIIVRPTDTVDDLKRKARIATILGTFQSTLTKFRYVRKVWQHNAEEERLLGVSMTGIMDNPILNGQETNWLEVTLKDVKNVTIETNKEWAGLLGIPVSAAITTVKPSGTVSQLVDSASGIHARFAPYYVRTVRNSINDPVTQFLIAQGVPHEVDVTNPGNMVFSFPIKAPEGAVFTKDLTALQQLEHYLTFKHHWCEHNPSITIYIKEGQEWLDMQAAVYREFDNIGGVSFLPHSDTVYKQAPYTEISEAEYESLVKAFPVVRWEDFKETQDNSIGHKELACTAGYCEI